jgi:hypothetical protein
MSHSGGGAPVMGGTGGGVLQCRRRRDRVRRTPLMSHDTGVARASYGEAVRRPGDGVDRLSGELGGSGARSGWRRKMERKGSEVGGRWLLKALGCAGRRGKKEGGPGFGARGGENGEERGGPGVEGDNSCGRHRPPAGGRGWRQCCATGEGGGVRATRAQAADGRDRR